MRKHISMIWDNETYNAFVAISMSNVERYLSVINLYIRFEKKTDPSCYLHVDYALQMWLEKRQCWRVSHLHKRWIMFKDFMMTWLNVRWQLTKNLSIHCLVLRKGMFVCIHTYMCHTHTHIYIGMYVHTETHTNTYTYGSHKDPSAK